MCNVIPILPIVTYTVIMIITMIPMTMMITTMIPMTMMITIMAHLTHLPLVILLAKRK